MPLLEAVCAKPMRWLGRLHTWLHHVGKSSTVDSLQLVALLLAIPVFKVRYLLFQALYLSQERRLRLAGFDKLMTGSQNPVEHFRGGLPDFGVGLQRLHCFRHIISGFEAAYGRTYSRNINHLFPRVDSLCANVERLERAAVLS